MKKITLFILITLITNQLPAQSLIIDHHCTQLQDIPEEWIAEAKANLKITYQHTSHGSQLVSGINAIAATQGSLFSFTSTGWGLVLGVFLNDYGMPGAGDLGHYGDLTWVNATIEILNNPNCDRNVVMWSWCGGVSDNDSTGIYAYLNAMNNLESEYPEVKFVYMTGHLDGGGENGNLNLMNNLIRDYCLENNKILFDFADIESFAPDYPQNFMQWCALDGLNYDPECENPWAGPNWGAEWVAANSAHPYLEMVDACSECAHSDSPAEAKLNCVLKGNAFWYLMARLTGWVPGTTVAENLSYIENYKVFPNPSDGIISITGHQSATSIDVTDMMGVSVYQKKGNFILPLQIDLSGKGNGIFFIKVENGNTTKTIKTMIHRGGFFY